MTLRTTDPHARPLVRLARSLPRSVRGPVRAVVAGGGIAGVTAALLLAERGVAVTLLERAPQLGGRLAAWPRTLPDGSRHMVGHGFHAFFRQYYNWRAVLRRIDPGLSLLRPVDRYPIVSRQWPEEDFTGLPGRPPLNLLALIARSPSLRLRELRDVDGEAALPLLQYSRDETYRRFDGVPAGEFLDRLGMPPRARAMLFDVFAHSFFNHPDDMSAAEMIMQFHFYFLRNPEGLGFDAPAQDYQTAIWAPFTAHLEALGVKVRTGAAVEEIEPGWAVRLAGGERFAADHVVLAADPGSARDLVAASPGLTKHAPRLAAQMATVRTTAPYAVSRFWTDRDFRADRSVFSGVSQEPTLDSISLYHRLEHTGAQWARRTGGAVVELHAYAAPDGRDAADLGRTMWGELCGLWDEARAMTVLDAEDRVGTDAPAFGVGSDATRPGVRTDADGVYLAGDWVRTRFPSALMERAAASGAVAANAILHRHGARPNQIWSIPSRGLLAPKQRVK
jgi:isorenieratene synthase